jgi:hypothetical protein
LFWHRLHSSFLYPERTAVIKSIFSKTQAA